MKKIPFWIFPGSWGLKGQSRKEAELQYYATSDYDREKGLIEIRSINELQKKTGLIELDFKYGKIDEYTKDIDIAKVVHEHLPKKDLQKVILEFDLKHGKIDQYEYDKKLIDLTFDVKDTLTEIALLEVEHKHNKITTREFNKQVATLKKEPWVDVDVIVDDNNPQIGEFRFDWNAEFIEMLQDSGFVSPKEDDVVQMWFNEVCRNVALEVFDGVGDFSDRVLGSEEDMMEKAKVFKRAQDEKNKRAQKKKGK